MSGVSSNELLCRAPTFVRRRVARDSADPELLVQLACDESYWVRRQAADNPALPSAALEVLVRAGATRDLRGFAVPDPTLSPERIESIVSRGKFAGELAVRHPRTPAKTLAALGSEGAPSLRLAVARHPNAATATLARLCSDLEVSVRVAAASHPGRADSVIELLRIGGASADLRVAGWPLREPSPEQLVMVWDSEPWGRFLAARRPGCPQGLLTRATRDPDWRVRAGVLENAEAPDALLEPYLLEGEIDLGTLRALGKRRPSRAALERIACHPDAEVRLSVAHHPGAWERVLGVLASDLERGVRTHVAQNPRTPRGEIERLVRAGSTPCLTEVREHLGTASERDLALLCQRGPWARMLVARHRSATPRQLAGLLCDPSPQIRQWALAHPDAPREVVRDLVRCGSGDDLQGFHEVDPEVSPETLVRLGKLGPWARRLVALHPAAPPGAIRRLARSGEWEVRRNVAMRRRLPAALRRELSRDPVAAVRLAASEQGPGVDRQPHHSVCAP
jgi:hypothetical protein